MEKYNKIIEVVMSSDGNQIFPHSDGYIEIQEDTANKLFQTLFGDITSKVNQVKIRGVSYRLFTLEIDELEVDSADDFSNGSFSFMGHGIVSGFEDPLMANIRTKNFKISDLWLTNMEDSTEVPFVDKGRLVVSMIKSSVYIDDRSQGSRYKITYGDYLEESVSMELKANPNVWKSVLSLWAKLAEAGKVYGDDEGMFFSFQSFYKSFMRRNNRKPLYRDALKFVATNYV